MKKFLNSLSNYIKVLRPKQWIKNSFIFFPMIFSWLSGEGSVFLSVVSIVFLFSVFSWATYIINDLHDKEKDVLHPKKRYRPIASGLISERWAWAWSMFLMLTSLCLVATFFGERMLSLFFVYLIYTLLYSFILKEQFLIDVFALSIGFLIRIMIGSEVLWLSPSLWLLSMTFFVSLWFGFSKRYQELTFWASTRKVLSQYSENFLIIALSMMTTIMIVIYIFYIYSEHKESLMVYSVPFFTFLVVRYLSVIFWEHDRSRSIEDILLGDLWILSSGVVIFILTILSLS